MYGENRKDDERHLLIIGLNKVDFSTFGDCHAYGILLFSGRCPVPMPAVSGFGGIAGLSAGIARSFPCVLCCLVLLPTGRPAG